MVELYSRVVDSTLLQTTVSILLRIENRYWTDRHYLNKHNFHTTLTSIHHVKYPHINNQISFLFITTTMNSQIQYISKCSRSICSIFTTFRMLKYCQGERKTVSRLPQCLWQVNPLLQICQYKRVYRPAQPFDIIS